MSSLPTFRLNTEELDMRVPDGDIGV